MITGRRPGCAAVPLVIMRGPMPPPHAAPPLPADGIGEGDREAPPADVAPPRRPWGKA